MATKKKSPVKKKTREVAKQAKMAISDKHKLFAMHYALTEDANDSAIKAGFSASTAMKKSYKWVGQSRAESFYPELFDIVQQVREQQIKPKLEEQFDITSDRVLRELARIGFSDIRKLFDTEGAMVQINQLSDDIAASVSSVEVDELWEYDPVLEMRKQVGVTKKLKMWDKKGSLELLGKHLGLFKEDATFKLPPNISFTIKSEGEAPVVKDGN